MLPIRAKVDLGAMAMKGYSAFPKASPSDSLVSYPEHSYGGGYSSGDSVSAYYGPSRLVWRFLVRFFKLEKKNAISFSLCWFTPRQNEECCDEQQLSFGLFPTMLK